MLKVKGLKKSFGDLDVLDIKHLTINDREVVGFIGKNGTGKTTLFKILLSLLNYDEADEFLVSVRKSA